MKWGLKIGHTDSTIAIHTTITVFIWQSMATIASEWRKTVTVVPQVDTCLTEFVKWFLNQW